MAHIFMVVESYTELLNEVITRTYTLAYTQCIMPPKHNLTHSHNSMIEDVNVYTTMPFHLPVRIQAVMSLDKLKEIGQPYPPSPTLH